jgi:prevent-host-death family protein
MLQLGGTGRGRTGLGSLTRDTIARMAEVTIRELRNHGGDVVDRVAAGERLTVTRDGRPVAELRPYRATPLSAAVLLRRWRRLPILDAESLRGGVDAVIDPRL